LTDTHRHCVQIWNPQQLVSQSLTPFHTRILCWRKRCHTWTSIFICTVLLSADFRRNTTNLTKFGLDISEQNLDYLRGKPLPPHLQIWLADLYNSAGSEYGGRPGPWSARTRHFHNSEWGLNSRRKPSCPSGIEHRIPFSHSGNLVTIWVDLGTVLNRMVRRGHATKAGLAESLLQLLRPFLRLSGFSMLRQKLRGQVLEVRSLNIAIISFAKPIYTLCPGEGVSKRMRFKFCQAGRIECGPLLLFPLKNFRDNKL